MFLVEASRVSLVGLSEVTTKRGLASACVHSLATTRLSREIVPNS
jgi:hypothetical protein